MARSRKLGSLVYDASRPEVCGMLAAYTRYYGIVLVDGKRRQVPHHLLRSGSPDQGWRKNWISKMPSAQVT